MTENQYESIKNVSNTSGILLYGQPFLELPRDLYIPPEALEVFLDTFEGPLDLLLYLIRKQNFNILDIPMAQVTAQYLHYVDQIRQRNLELASEYLLMAGVLIEIKSRLLLPQKINTDEAEAEDPRAELARRLIEYEQMKSAARAIDDLPVSGRDFYIAHVDIVESEMPKWPQVAAIELHDVLAKILKRQKLVQHHQIKQSSLSVREQMSFILRQLNDSHFVEFYDLLEKDSKLCKIVANFIALLELTKESLIAVTQAEVFAPIYIKLNYTRCE